MAKINKNTNINAHINLYRYWKLVRPVGSEPAQVHFLYFWKAFGEAARIAGALAIEHDSLAVELLGCLLPRYGRPPLGPG